MADHELPDSLTPKEAAMLANVTPRTAVNWCLTGAIPATKVGGRWTIHVDQMAERNPGIYALFQRRAAVVWAPSRATEMDGW